MFQLEAGFDISRAFNDLINRQQRFEQFSHPAKWPGIGAIRKRLGRIGVRLHKEAIDPDGDRGAGEYGDKLALTARRCALPTWQLNRMRCIKNHGACGLAEDRKRAHV